MNEAERRKRIWDALRAWVATQDNYYVGYEFGGLSSTTMSPSFESLVDEVLNIVKEEPRS